MKELTRKLAHAHLKNLRKMAEGSEERINLAKALRKRTKQSRHTAWAVVNRTLKPTPETMSEPSLGMALLLEECAEEIKKGKS